MTVEEIKEGANTPVFVDVRTGEEFGHGHIPGALNLPLFNEEERAE
ncbi:MAG TPA: rhodanese-like domain-containing protein, partial [Bdellovibrionota bacterium]|nr:rhodanese-like domain-containing protein [Bdellovibrionota bacterium]